MHDIFLCYPSKKFITVTANRGVDNTGEINLRNSTEKEWARSGNFDAILNIA